MAERKTFTPVFEETEETILARILEHEALAAWRKEPGDYMYDAVAPDAAEIQLLQIGLDTVLRDRFAQYAEGDALDEILAGVGLVREAATYSKRSLTITADAGVSLAQGQKLTSLILDSTGTPLQFTLDAAVTFAAGSTSQAVAVTCTTAGTAGNLAAGSQFILTPTIPGIRSIVDNGITTAAQDAETDAAAFKRYDFLVNNPDTGGNKSDLKRWAESVAGVGASRIIPRWAGNMTSKIVIVGDDLAPASADLVAAVQAFMDPGSTGLGDGKAPAGNKVTVVSAAALTVDITAAVTYYSGVSAATVKAAFTQAVEEYLAAIVFTDTAVSVAKIGSLLIGTYGVANYSGLQINGGTADLAVGTEQVAVIGAVTV